MQAIKFLILFIASAMLFTACAEKDTKVYSSAEEMVATAKEDIQTMSMEEFKTLLDKGSDIQIVDCRPQYDFILGHFPTAMHVPRGVLEFSGKLSNRRPKTLVFGNEMGSAALAVKSLEKLKYSDVYMLDFSWFDWEDQYPDLVAQGMDEAQPAAPAKQETSSGGCGG